MVTIEASVDINRPIEEVWAYVTDPTKAPQWSSMTLESTVEGTGPIGVGSRISGIGKFLGRRLETISEVTQFDPPSKFAMRVVSGGNLEIERLLEPIVEGTRYRSRLEGDSGGLFKLAEPIVAALMRRTVETDLHTLKALLEAKLPAGA